LTVIANNGWSANVTRPESVLIRATGTGHWNSDLTSFVTGRNFNVDFVLKGARLHMTMLIDMKNGPPQTIKAVFERVWFGA